jgi:rubrerythrin
VIDMRRSHAGIVLAVLGAAIVAVGPAAAREDEETVPSSVRAQVPDLGHGAMAETLRVVFAHEMNTKAWYAEAARIADAEGYPHVASVFRACARAEQAHADEHVHAIAIAGGEARVVLDRLALRGTADNLRDAIAWETYDAEQVYPALLARARAEANPSAIRSLNYALGAEREHARLFAEALATLEEKRPASEFHVCGTCGKTVATIDFTKCPNCFAGARGFVRVK